MGRPANCDCRCSAVPECHAFWGTTELTGDDRLVTQFAILEDLAWQFVEVLEPPETLTLTFYRSYYHVYGMTVEQFSMWNPAGFSAAALTWNAAELRYEGTLNASPNDDLGNTVSAYIRVCRYAPGYGGAEDGRVWIFSGQLVGTEGATLSVSQLSQEFSPLGTLVYSGATIGDPDLGALSVVAPYWHASDTTGLKDNFHRFLIMLPEVLLVSNFGAFGECVCGRMGLVPESGTDDHCPVGADGYYLGLRYLYGLYPDQYHNYAMRNPAGGIDGTASQMLWGRYLSENVSGDLPSQFAIQYTVDDYCARQFVFANTYAEAFDWFGSNEIPFLRSQGIPSCGANSAFDECDPPDSLTVAFAAWERTEDYPVGF